MLKQVDVRLHTDGKGLWTQYARAVRVIGLELGYVNETKNFGELRVYFDQATWATQVMGVIYTDPLFFKELKDLLKSIGIKGGKGIMYSEYGMQGDNFVSLDVGPTFIKSFRQALDKVPAF